MMMLDYKGERRKGGGGGQKYGKSDYINLNYVINYVICKLLSNQFVSFLLKFFFDFM